MRRLLALLFFALLAVAIGYGCAKKEPQESDKVPVEVKEAEQMDTTRMDSAMMVDSTMMMDDSGMHNHDSM